MSGDWVVRFPSLDLEARYEGTHFTMLVPSRPMSVERLAKVVPSPLEDPDA